MQVNITGNETSTKSLISSEDLLNNGMCEDNEDTYYNYKANKDDYNNNIKYNKVNLEVKYTPNIQIWPENKSINLSPFKETTAEANRHQIKVINDSLILNDINSVLNKLDNCNSAAIRFKKSIYFKYKIIAL